MPLTRSLCRGMLTVILILLSEAGEYGFLSPTTRNAKPSQTVPVGDVRMVPHLRQAYAKVVEDSSDEQETQ